MSSSSRPVFHVQPAAPGFLAHYAFVGAYAALFAVYRVWMSKLKGFNKTQPHLFDAPADKNLSASAVLRHGPLTFQRAYRRTFCGEVLFALLVCYVLVLPQVSLLLSIVAFYQPTLSISLWWANTVWDLGFCTEKQIISDIVNNVEKETVKNCTQQLQPTDQSFHFNNMGMVMIVFWLLGLAGMRLFTSTFGRRVRTWFYQEVQVPTGPTSPTRKWTSSEHLPSSTSSTGSAGGGATGFSAGTTSSTGAPAKKSTSSSLGSRPVEKKEPSRNPEFVVFEEFWVAPRERGDFFLTGQETCSSDSSEDNHNLSDLCDARGAALYAQLREHKNVRWAVTETRAVQRGGDGELFLECKGSKFVVQGCAQEEKDEEAGKGAEKKDAGKAVAPRFVKLAPSLANTTLASQLYSRAPHTEEFSLQQHRRLGENKISVETDTYVECLKAELCDFLSLLQVHGLWSAVLFTNYMLAIIQVAFFLLFGFLNAYAAWRAQQELSEAVASKGGLLVERHFKLESATSSAINNKLEEETFAKLVPASKLVPGDVITVEEGCVPCDCVLLSGAVVLNESNLTGEAMPIQKFPIERSDARPLHYKTHGKRSLLYAGSTVVQKSRRKNTAMVVSIGASTWKGRMIAELLTHDVPDFELTNSMQVLMVINMGISLLFCALFSIFANESFATMFVGNFFEALILFARLTSPFVLVGWKVLQRRAAMRLRATKKIRTFRFSRLAMAGKVEVMCLDKTGTLTEESLHLHGVRRCNFLTNTPTIEEEESFVFSETRLLDLAMATCHTVCKMNGKCLGNKVECELVEKCGMQNFERDEVANVVRYKSGFDGKSANNEEDSSTSSVYTTVREFEFCQHLQLQSVVVECGRGRGGPASSEQRRHESFGDRRRYLFTKGSPEQVAKRCAVLPQNLAQEVEREAGNYVIAFGYKELPFLSATEKGSESDKSDIDGVQREDLEVDLQFLGLAIFRNELKPCSAGAIRDLQDGGIQCVIVTGDNVLNGLHVAKKCRIVPHHSNIRVGSVNSKNGQFRWDDFHPSKSEEASEASSDEAAEAEKEAAEAENEKSMNEEPLLAPGRARTQSASGHFDAKNADHEYYGLTQAAYDYLWLHRRPFLHEIFPRVRRRMLWVRH